ncbi:hypothetical protein [Allopontixanthobacter sediminis]|uniref:Uncharacterized protein n=1 Tax=Allopontixanthobacter sediminis TaxID=1689985 RepID=A0A845ATS9_9SPHN|nr:hypothetical protein [Allopontixanthobacter sediminis]MXP42963.1 hypothetical protein [Allopontixanthobacter sediminis]
MKNSSKLFSQIAAEAGCTPNKAKTAAFLFGLSEDGSTIDRAARLLCMKPNTIKVYAREFLIDFADYRPFARDEKSGRSRPDPTYRLGLDQ